MINKLLRKSWNPLIFRIFSLIVFIFLIFVLYFGSIKLIFNFTNTWVLFLLWTLWWPFLYISLLFLGRIWCGFICPIGLINEMSNSLTEPKKDFLRRYYFLPFLILFLVALWEEISGLFFSTHLTMLFLISFILLAFIIGLILPRWGFCKYFCPVGTILNVFSRLSFVGIRTNKEICKDCKTKECLRGGKTSPCPLFNYVPGINSNKNCLLCTNCIKNCPHHSAKLSIVKPGKEIKEKIKFNLYESFFIVSLLGFAIFLTSKGSQIARFFIGGLTGGLLRIWDFIFWIFVSCFLFILINLSKKNFKENLIKGGYAILPLVFSLFFILIVFGFLPLIKGTWSSLSKYLILLIGSVWSINLSINLFKKRKWIYLLSIILILFFFIGIIFQGPLNISNKQNNIYYAQDGDILKMNAFSMGFNPNIIYAHEGNSFKINLTSLDTPHSFDIDELNIHMTFRANSLIKLNNLSKGEYEYYCAIPGHKEAGMKGVLIVK